MFGGYPAIKLLAHSPKDRKFLPTGVWVSPLATPGSICLPLVEEPGGQVSSFQVGQPAIATVSPNGQLLLVVTSGYNLFNLGEVKASHLKKDEYVFLFQLSDPNHPTKLGVWTIPNSFYGACWHPRGNEFYVSGGKDDCIWVFRKEDGGWNRKRSISLGHKHGNGPGITPVVAGVGISPKGDLLLAANLANDSVTVIDLQQYKPVAELDLRPGAGVAGGEYPFWVTFIGPEKAYVSSLRDREVIAIGFLKGKPIVSSRIPVAGQPNRLLASHTGKRLYVIEDNSDRISVLDTANERWIESIPIPGDWNRFSGLPRRTRRAANFLPGSNPNAAALSPDGGCLYVSCGAINAVAMVQLGAASQDPDKSTAAQERSRSTREGSCSQPSKVVALLPTGWYPSSVDIAADGRTLFVTDMKTDPGPNPNACQPSTRPEGKLAPCRLANEYVWQLTKGDLLILPIPREKELHRLTSVVLQNNRVKPTGSFSLKLAKFLRDHIHHIVYVIKENRTYDQVLGDLEKGDGDPRLTLFPEPLTPNHHELARTFVTLDRFFCSGEVSGNGWNWSTAGRATDFTEKTVPVAYAGRGLSSDWEGENRNVNVGWASVEERKKAFPGYPDDPDLLPGTRDVAAPDGPGGQEGAGYLWDAALRAKKTVRNYGFFVDLSRYWLPPSHPGFIPITPEPFRQKIVQAYPTKRALIPHTDPYFRGFDMRNADFWLYQEWEREFDAYVHNGHFPHLSLVRFPHDHFGAFKDARFGVNTVETQMADNDYALGLLVEKIAHSPHAKDTLVFVIEDDAQDGPDHVHSHRSLALVAGPYVRQGAVISTPYTTVDLLRTLFDILGLEPSCQELAFARFMGDIFDPNQKEWTYTARIPDVLRSTELPLPLSQKASQKVAASRQHNADYWEKLMQGENFTQEDRLDPLRFNEALWRGMRGE